MALLALNLFFGLAGITIITLATWRFIKLIKQTRAAAYHEKKGSSRSEVVPLALMYCFIAAFTVSIADTVLGPATRMSTVMLSVFFCVALFIHSTVNSQIAITMLLREKNMEIMKTFVNTIDLKDSYTKGHSEHVYDLVNLIYEHLPEKLRAPLNKPKLLDAAMLHDCGKISIKDEILNKRGRLSQEDWEAIKGHAATGKRMLDDTCFSGISYWVLYHHERVDGKGYYGLAGKEIPLESRIIAIADTYSALTTDRIYRKRYAHDQAVEIMALSTGSQLDTELMGCFMRIPLMELEKVRPRDSIIYVENPSQGSSAPDEKNREDARTGDRTNYLQ